MTTSHIISSQRLHPISNIASSSLHGTLNAAHSGEGSAGGQAKLRILLVDDNEDAVHSLEKLLTLLGYEARSTTSGADALVEGEHFCPDVVLLDLGMPDMDGFETAAAMRAKPWGGRVRIIALTGWGQQEDMRRTQAAGFVAHLVKPLKTYELLQLLQKNK